MFPIRRLAATGAGPASSTSRSPEPRSVPGFGSSVLTEKPSHRRRVGLVNLPDAGRVVGQDPNLTSDGNRYPR